MSLRLKALATINALGWLVAVPVLIAALLSPIVGFNGWQERPPGDRVDTVRLADAPRHAPARVAAAPQRGRTASPARPRSRSRALAARAGARVARAAARPRARHRRRAGVAARRRRLRRPRPLRRLCPRLHPPCPLRSPSR